MKLNKPKTSITEVLHELITKGETSMLNFSYMPGYRTRISEIINRYNLPLIRDLKQGVNKFKNGYTYAVHKLKPFYKRQAITLYNNLNK